MSNSFMPTDWKVTDPDTGQRGRRVGSHAFEFVETGRSPMIVDLTKYTYAQIVEHCSAYYPSMDYLYDCHGSESSWIIAECIYEMTAPLQNPLLYV